MRRTRGHPSRHPARLQCADESTANNVPARRRYKFSRQTDIPRRVNGELYGSFLPGTKENLQRALDGLMEFLPSRSWFDQADADSYAD